jgi:hypothetical protein
VHTGFWWGGLREKYHLEGPVVDGRIILKRIFKKRDVEMAQGRTVGGLL